MASTGADRNAAGRPAPRAPVETGGETGADAAGLPARQAALTAVAELLAAARPGGLDEALSAGGREAGLGPADAGLARAIAATTFRRLGLIRAALAERMPRGFPDDQPRLAALLATASAQILDLAVPDHAAVDLAVRLAKADPRNRHQAGLVNAVLRRLVREREAVLADADPLAQNAPAWLGLRWTRTYGAARAADIARAHLAGASLDLTPRADPEAWAERLGARLLPTGSLRLADPRTAVPDLPGFEEGAWWVQDAAAAIPARLLDARPGERVADLCAAPGGKTMQLAATGAAVTALDRSGPRLERLRANLARTGLTAEVVAADALGYAPETPFDAVLLDAPCSATGTLRRHPEVAWTKSEGDLARLGALQGRLLDAAARLVRPGGRIVYCTCSLEPEEGEAQAASFLARHPGFERVPVRPDEIGGLDAIDGQGDLRTLPCLLDGTVPGGRGGLDGFFATRLVRRD